MEGKEEEAVEEKEGGRLIRGWGQRKLVIRQWQGSKKEEEKKKREKVKAKTNEEEKEKVEDNDETGKQ